MAQTIASGCTFEDAAEQQQKMAGAGAWLVTIGDPRYPQLLREIFDPPVLLFARGRVELLQTICAGRGRNAAADALRTRGGGAAVGRPGACRD